MMLDPFLLLETQQTQGEFPELFLTRVNGTRVDHGSRSPQDLTLVSFRPGCRRNHGSENHPEGRNGAAMPPGAVATIPL